VKPGGDMVFTLDLLPEDTLIDLSRYAAKLPITRWAILVPNITYGLVSADTIQKQLLALNPKAQIVDRQVFVDGSANFEAIIQNMKAKQVEGVITAVYAKGLEEYLVAARRLDFLDKTVHISTYMPPENMEPLGGQMPKNWFVLGYPQEKLKTPENLAFLKAFDDRFHEMPGISGLISYIDMKFTLAALEKTPEPLKASDIATAARGLSLETPAGKLTLDAHSQHADMGYWFGLTDIVDGKPQLTHFHRTGESEK
jgi:branched-chain amino acid transport system substrate-binding protein